MPCGYRDVHLEIHSTIDALDLVQAVTEHIARRLGFDDESLHWTAMAVRESVVNAITHGNGNDPAKVVFIDYSAVPDSNPADFIVSVRDQGTGFDPDAVKDPLDAGEHAQRLRARRLPDSAVHGRRRDTSRSPGRHGDADDQAHQRETMTSNPLLLSTAIEAVIKAGEIQMSFIDSGFEVSHKGTIDLVTEADVAVETMFRKMIAERFPDHTILAEEFGEDAATRGASHCWVFDPIDGTNNYAHGLPIFCSSLALEIDGKGEIGAIYDPTRKELFVAERGGGAFLNGRPIHVSSAPTLVESMLVTGFPYDIHKRIPEIVGLFGEFVGKARAVRRLGSAALDLCYVAAGRMDGFWEQDLKPWDIAAGTIIVEEAGGRVTDFAGEPYSSRRSQILATNGAIHEEMLAITNAFLRSRI